MITNKELYLNLMKKTLSYLLWPEPPTPIQFVRLPPEKRLKRWIAIRIAKFLSKLNLTLSFDTKIVKEKRKLGQMRPLYADTMIGEYRLDNIQY